ncbi:Rnf electron transport complex subunit RnfB [Xanthomonas campestris pv. badrii]|uniref:Rnf electron transport complex subunit RnfB n=2 Tax=Xanthomonas campestris TaxID=339 RepID=A0A7Z2V8V4_XANCA|nr:Rnf electron transport complex subunit RnfB [Xanthomonas campestris pv. parthenii]QJD67204.1 Rnf electron transport complex subunit RnfB [Xanthomonas campestris pv. badrii]
MATAAKTGRCWHWRISAGIAAIGCTDTAMPVPTPDLVERLDRLLPQTQCGQCGYDGCRPYAQAMADGHAGVDHCPPGGDAGARALAQLLGVPARPYDRSRGAHKPAQVAWIVEADCIGCTKCIQACPVDAIVGGAKHMHTVIAPLCTGCELCLPACPVDCIALHPLG